MILFSSIKEKSGGITAVIVLVTVILVGLKEVNALLFTGDTPNDALTVDASGHWFVYADSGKPYFMAGLGGPEGFLYLNDNRKQEIVNEIIQHGVKAIYIHSIRSHGGDGNQSENPFNKHGDANSGVNMTILDNWDVYLSRLDQAGVTIWFNIYDDGSRPWDACNANLPQAEKEYIATLVNRFKHYRHLVWLPTEEHKMKACSDDSLDIAKAQAIAAEIRLHDPVHPVGVHHNNGDSFAYNSEPNINVFGQQICEDVTQRSVDGIHNAGMWGDYVYVMAECHPWHKNLLAGGNLGRTQLRQSLWATALAGGYVLLYDSYETSDPTPEILEDIRRLNEFMDSTHFEQMSPADRLAHGDTKWVMANERQNLYLLYSNENPGNLGVLEPGAGIYDLVWYDPVNGNTITETATVTSGNHIFNKPAGIGKEAVLYLTGRIEPMPTGTPTNTPTETNTPTSTFTPDPSPTPSPVHGASVTPTDTSIPTLTATPTSTFTPDPSQTPSPVPSASATPTPTLTPSPHPVPPSIPDTNWSYLCNTDEMLNVKIIGVGMGNGEVVQNPQTLIIPDGKEASFIIAQVAVKNYRTGEQPESVTISTGIERHEMFAPTSSGNTFHYEVILQATDQITATVKGDGSRRKTPRGLIAYAFYDYSPYTERYADSGHLVDAFIFGSSHLENFSIPTTDHTRDVNVTFVLSDVQDDLRTAVLQATAGDITRQVTISQPNYGDELLIYTIPLPDVPGDVNAVTASVTSPVENGDSLYWSGVNISTGCQ